MRIVIPEHIGMRDWFDSLRATFPNLVIPSVQKDDDWKVIASYIRNYSEFRGRVPGTEGYADWRGWARSFYNNIGG